MARRYINSLEKPSHRRGRFRRGFAFGFFALAGLYAVVGWVITVTLGKFEFWQPQPLGAVFVPLVIAGLLYVGAIFVGETQNSVTIERWWLGFMTLCYTLLGFWLVFTGTLYIGTLF